MSDTPAPPITSASAATVPAATASSATAPVTAGVTATAAAAATPAPNPRVVAKSPKHDGPPTTTVGPANLDGRWHFAPVELWYETDVDGGFRIRCPETPAVGTGPDKRSAMRAWMTAVVRRRAELAGVEPASHSPEQAREWKWMGKVLVRS